LQFKHCFAPTYLSFSRQRWRLHGLCYIIPLSEIKENIMYEVNRSVFLLIPLEPFWNWLQTLPGNHLDGLTLEDIQADANSYLVRPCETADEVWDEIEARFEDIFAAELADWCEDESEWPDLDADIFNELNAVLDKLCENLPDYRKLFVSKFNQCRNQCIVPIAKL